MSLETSYQEIAETESDKDQAETAEAPAEETAGEEKPAEDGDKKPSDDLLEGGQSAEIQEQKPEEKSAQEIDPNAVKNELMNRGKMRIPKAQFSVKDVLRQRRENGKKVVMTPKQEIEFRKKGLSPKQELKRRRNISK